MTNTRLLLLGDSLIDFGNWSQRLPHYSVISSGIPGEHTHELLRRLPPNISGRVPDTIVLMSGTNNLLFGDTSFVRTLEEIITILTQSYPKSEILLCSLLPYEIQGFEEKIRAVNENLRIVAERTASCYFDLYSAFVKAGEPLFDDDGVHLSEAAYQLWAEMLTNHIAERLANESN